MAINEDYLNYVIDQLSNFGDITVKKMFGGVGLFRDGLMFALIGGDIFRLKADEINQPDFEEKGMHQHTNSKGKKGMPYWEVPAEILEDKTQLALWATKSFEAALRSKK